MSVPSRPTEEPGADPATALVDDASFRDAMSRFASGVAIVTTADADGNWIGFTASAFCSLSLEPALVIVCQARGALSYSAFMRCERFVVNVLGEEHKELALRFATRGADKFRGGEFRAGRTGLPRLRDALATVACDMHARHDGGDHVIYIGEVYYCRVRSGAPALHFDRRFWGLGERDSGVGR